jgi:gliding motility-associated-like protein
LQFSLPGGITVRASNDTSVCYNSPVRLFATGADTYQWSPSAGLNDSTSATLVATPTVPTTYIVTGTAAGGCTGIDSVRVTVSGEIKVDAYGDGQPISCNHSLAQLHASGATSYVWHPGQYLNDSTQAHPVATPPKTMLFTVEGRSGDGCVGRDTIRVLVEPGATLYIPNVFTPNGDGLNDVVYPTIYCDFHFDRFAMFNRWGQKLFETKDYTMGWNGRYNGEYCEQGVYTYYISGTTSLGAPVLFKGNVTLLR